MKADLEFDCEDLEDEMKLKRMLLASDLCYVIFEMQQYLRSRLKYTEEYKSSVEEIEDIQSHLSNLMVDNCVDLNKIYS